jgi:hypothetical protein
LTSTIGAEFQKEIRFVTACASSYFLIAISHLELMLKNFN